MVCDACQTQQKINHYCTFKRLVKPSKTSSSRYEYLVKKKAI